MNSLTSQITHSDICAQIRMERQTHRGSFLLVEGANDGKRFKKFVSGEQCSLVVCYGKKNLQDSIEALQDRGLTGAIGLADLDFDHLMKARKDNEDIIYSKFHDFDVDMFSTMAFERYLLEMADEAKVKALGGVTAIREAVLHLIRPLSALRFVNEYFSMGYKLKDLKLKDTLLLDSVNVERMISLVSFGNFNTPECRLLLFKRINAFLKQAADPWHLSNGHDVFAGVSFLLEDRIGARKGSQNYPSEVERHLRLAFALGDMAEIGLLENLRDWEKSSGGYRVLLE